MRNTFRVLYSVIISLLPVAGPAAVTPQALFSDGAVVQCEMAAPVWGTANAGEKVTVTFAGQTVATEADSQGVWLVKLKPLKPNAEPQTMTIAGETTVTISNLLVGEVWICSGQSNMYWPLADTTNATTAIAAANDPQIRLFTVGRGGSERPRRDVTGTWLECNSNTVAAFSAVGYYFGRDLRQAVKRPIGLIHASVGGTEAERWTSRATLENVPALRGLIANHEKALADYQTAWTAYRTTRPAQRPSSAPVNPANNGPASLYNAMIAPLQPVAMRGVIWYQGESNNDRAEEYKVLFPAMIQGWREAWGAGEFPFLFVQIAPYISVVPELREAQLVAWQKTPKTAVVVITDYGEARNVHPKQKEPVGARLALAARAVAYGEKLEYSGPVIETIKVASDKAVLTFTHLGGGLVAQGGELKGFTIAGPDNKFVPANARIDGKTVVVTSTNVAQPVAVAYGWASVPAVNLFNSECLPATPFRIQVPK